MIEFLLEMLFLLLEMLAEFVLAGGADLVLRAIAKVFKVGSAKPVVALIGYALLGCFAGLVSLRIFPYPIVRPSKLHGISLFIAPIGTGLLMSMIGSILGRKGKKVTRIESFGYGFSFAFGMALMRYVFAVQS